jgi:tRNA threonylcarbamoyladenosine biosynthesis protein TsaB
VAKLSFWAEDTFHDYEWQADRRLAKELLPQLEKQLQKRDKTWKDISGIGVFLGPGSFTGLRIGLTVANTLADSLNIPIVGSPEGSWREIVVHRIQSGENDQIILPYYGSEAHITLPRK